MQNRSPKNSFSSRKSSLVKPLVKPLAKTSVKPLNQTAATSPVQRNTLPPKLDATGEFREAFKNLWTLALQPGAHLDAVLSRAPRHLKSALAETLPWILRRPASLSQAFGFKPLRIENQNAVSESSCALALKIATELQQCLEDPDELERLQNLEPLEGDFPETLLQCFGKNKKPLMEALSELPAIGLRVRSSCDLNQMRETLQKDIGEVLPVTLSTLSPVGLRLDGYASILKTESFTKGQFEIQDEGSQILSLFALWPERYAPLLTAEPGPHPKEWEPLPLPSGKTPSRNIIDTCAGAGGKTLAMADALRGRGRVYAYDVSAGKLKALRNRLGRWQMTNVQTLALEEGNESVSIEKFKASAQTVLVDAPCSGWGVLRRSPNIKWFQNPDELLRLSRLQLHLLELYAPLVKAGGNLIYGVCTFRTEETKSVVSEFLEKHPEFELTHSGYLGPDRTDGFYMAGLRLI